MFLTYISDDDILISNISLNDIFEDDIFESDISKNDVLGTRYKKNE